MESKGDLEVVDVAIPISAVLAEKDGEELVSIMGTYFESGTQIPLENHHHKRQIDLDRHDQLFQVQDGINHRSRNQNVSRSFGSVCLHYLFAGYKPNFPADW